MSNEAAKLVAESLLGVSFRTILINNEAYTIYPPTIKIICRGIREWSKIDFNEEDTNKIDVIKGIPDNSSTILRGLCYFIVGDVKGYRWKAYRLFRKLRYGTPSIRPDDMREAVKTTFDLIQGQDFFDCAALCKSVAKMAANRK
jgi:hypothetical protein